MSDIITTYTMTGSTTTGIQAAAGGDYIVPGTDMYQVTLVGADGGGGANNNTPGGLGESITVDLFLTQGVNPGIDVGGEGGGGGMRPGWTAGGAGFPG